MWEREGVSAPVAGLRDAVRPAGAGVLFVEGEAGLRKSSALDRARVLAPPDLRVALGQGDPARRRPARSVGRRGEHRAPAYLEGTGEIAVRRAKTNQFGKEGRDG
jgi:hypothetical protein